MKDVDNCINIFLNRYKLNIDKLIFSPIFWKSKDVLSNLHLEFLSVLDLKLESEDQ